MANQKIKHPRATGVPPGNVSYDGEPRHTIDSSEPQKAFRNTLLDVGGGIASLPTLLFEIPLVIIGYPVAAAAGGFVNAFIDEHSGNNWAPNVWKFAKFLLKDLKHSAISGLAILAVGTAITGGIIGFSNSGKAPAVPLNPVVRPTDTPYPPLKLDYGSSIPETVFSSGTVSGTANVILENGFPLTVVGNDGKRFPVAYTTIGDVVLDPQSIRKVVTWSDRGGVLEMTNGIQVDLYVTDAGTFAWELQK